MWTKFDQLSKAVLDRALGPTGASAMQHEITGEVQAADLWFRPAPEREAERERLGWLGRMADEPCLFEPFHATPPAGAVLDCMSKQLNLRGMLLRETARQASEVAWPRSLVPRLWILSAGRPERAMRSLKLEPMDGWPAGFWQAVPLLRMHLMVVRDLPETHDTLLLRLLGRGKTFRNAMHDLHALPDDAWEKELGIPQLLLAYRIGIFQDSEEDDMSYADELQAIYDDWAARIKHEGWEQGEQAGWKKGEQAGWKKGRLQSMRDNLCLFYQARFGTLPSEVQAAIASVEEADTLQQWIVPFATRTPEEIMALVRGHRDRAHPGS